jgi:hypothetical protein
MSRFVNYEEACAFAARQDRLTVDALVRSLGATPAAAASFLRRLQQDGLIGPAEENGAHPVAGRGGRRRYWGEAQGAKAAPAPEVRIAELEAELARLRLQAEEADFWRRRALAAEQRQPGGPQASEPTAVLQGRVDALRRMLAKELHPDAARLGTDRAVHAEIFKAVWPRIEAVLRGEPEPAPEPPAG